MYAPNDTFPNLSLQARLRLARVPGQRDKIKRLQQLHGKLLKAFSDPNIAEEGKA